MIASAAILSPLEHKQLAHVFGEHQNQQALCWLCSRWTNFSFKFLIINVSAVRHNHSRETATHLIKRNSSVKIIWTSAYTNVPCWAVHSFHVVMLYLNVVSTQISAGPYFKTEPERSSGILFVFSSHPVELEEEKGGQRISKSSLSSFLQGIQFWRNTDTELPLPCWQIRAANKEGNETNYFLSGSQAALCEEAAGCTTLTVTQKHTWVLPGLHTSTLLSGALILRHLPTPEPAARTSSGPETEVLQQITDPPSVEQRRDGHLQWTHQQVDTSNP